MWLCNSIIWHVTHNCCDIGNGADMIELIIVGINGGVARGVVPKLSESSCPLCALEYPIGREIEYLRIINLNLILLGIFLRRRALPYQTQCNCKCVVDGAPSLQKEDRIGLHLSPQLGLELLRVLPLNGYMFKIIG